MLQLILKCLTCKPQTIQLDFFSKVQNIKSNLITKTYGFITKIKNNNFNICLFMMDMIKAWLEVFPSWLGDCMSKDFEKMISNINIYLWKNIFQERYIQDLNIYFIHMVSH